MSRTIRYFERTVRNAFRFTEQRPISPVDHPFEVRDIHPSLPSKVNELFDDAHYRQATFEACLYLDSMVKKHAQIEETGKDLMMKAFGRNPLITLNPLANRSDRNEQDGYKFLFAGTMIAIRNPRGHEHSLEDDIGSCLDHLSLVSHLLRRLEQAGYPCS